ncbi:MULTISPECIES: lipopolysaccharide assembly LapA domain-containing protein [Okeania]|uniref:LapA family protein n=1 Tax=Okeania hirsuta TaxID=1458930 RepID=A0A3N6PXQ2_9CYAN|nr:MULTISPECIES: LapA family protein [Okeania]NET12196.1 LapA family protein [Okeania sp. SIO1H6]NES75460.1 LapA family protein [Okeania sp. SIO1H4]NES92941.1 LapA family protein [Okeania sp. SIO2B9]NET17883.1 LapA family protein [Okeania sp. SIO1H5]NET77296.1 LapA family protein [Okeania sp. SIO1F9]
MRPINFLLIFLVCLALVIFSLQNTQLTTIKLIQGIEFEAPLSVELVIATGLGAILAWLFNLWSRMQRTITTLGEMREIRTRNKRIKELEKDMERYQEELIQRASLPAAETLSETGKSTEAETSK